MTTWEMSSEETKREIARLIERLNRSGSQPPPLPSSARAPGLEGLTKKDAGTLLTALREAIAELDA